MKHSVIKFAIPILLVLTLTSGIIFWNTTTTYKIPPENCEVLLGNSAEEFVKKYGNFLDFNDDVVCAKLDDDGNLLMTLTDQDAENWISTFQPYLDSAKATDGIEISKDYRKITVKCFQENAADIFLKLTPAFTPCYINQVLNGIDPCDLNIEFIVLDAGTEEIIHHEVLSGKTTTMTFESASFSSKNDNCSP